jgi:hypothetical protein
VRRLAAFAVTLLGLTLLPGCSPTHNGSACRPASASILGPLLNGRELTSCARKGATVGGNPAATEQARRNGLGQLASLLR